MISMAVSSCVLGWVAEGSVDRVRLDISCSRTGVDLLTGGPQSLGVGAGHVEAAGRPVEVSEVGATIIWRDLTVSTTSCELTGRDRHLPFR
jgi:hypothetical protein